MKICTPLAMAIFHGSKYHVLEMFNQKPSRSLKIIIIPAPFLLLSS